MSCTNPNLNPNPYPNPNPNSSSRCMSSSAASRASSPSASPCAPRRLHAQTPVCTRVPPPHTPRTFTPLATRASASLHPPMPGTPLIPLTHPSTNACTPSTPLQVRFDDSMYVSVANDGSLNCWRNETGRTRDASDHFDCANLLPLVSPQACDARTATAMRQCTMHPEAPCNAPCDAPCNASCRAPCDAPCANAPCDAPHNATRRAPTCTLVASPPRSSFSALAHTLTIMAALPAVRRRRQHRRRAAR
jgi:hypothetical protein